MIPSSSNSSLRSFSRTGRVSIPSRSSRSSLSLNSAPRGTARRNPAAASDSDTRALLGAQGDVDALDVECEADGGQRSAEVPEQIVVAPAGAQRHAVGGVIHLEDLTGVVAEVVKQAEVEDDALRGA